MEVSAIKNYIKYSIMFEIKKRIWGHVGIPEGNYCDLLH